MPDPLSTSPKVLSHRAGLPSLAAGIQLNSGSAGPLPSEVAAAMDELARYERDFGRAQSEYYLETLQRMDEARAGVAAVLGGGLDEVALTHATTDGLNVGVWSIDWRAGDRAVTSSQEHAGLLGPLHAVRDRLGVELVFVEVALDATDDDVVAAFDAAIAPGTRLVALSHVLYTTGRVMPVARIAALAHARGAVVLVDGAQAAGAIPVHVEELGVDLYAVPAQKWLLGPEGMGALWMSSPYRSRALRTFAGGASWASHDGLGGHADHDGARAFEASGWHRPSILGMARAIGWLTMFVGLPWAFERAAALAAHAADRLAAMPGVELLTPRPAMGTLLTFRLPAWGAQAVADELGARCFAIVRTVTPLDAVRISVGWFTTVEELDRALDVVALLGAHTPETVPPRRTLPILGID